MAGFHLRFKAAAKVLYRCHKAFNGKCVWITNDAVGRPTDNREDREYKGPRTNWIRPPNSTGEWIQCNTNTVEFAGDIVDQFIHKFRDMCFYR